MTDRTDSFTRADSTTSIQSPSDGGSNYTINTGTWGISSNTGYLVSATNQASAVLETSVTDGSISVKVPTWSSDIGLIGRCLDDSNYILGAVTIGQTFRMFKRVAGTFTQLGTTNGTAMVSNDTIKLEITSGNVITLYQNGVSRCTATDSAHSTRTMWGLRSHADNVSRFDDLSFVGAGGGGGIVGPLIGARHLLGGGALIGGRLVLDKIRGWLMRAARSLQFRNERGLA